MQGCVVVRGQLRSSLMRVNRSILLSGIFISLIFASCATCTNLMTQLLPASVGWCLHLLLRWHVIILSIVGLRCGQVHCGYRSRCLYLLIQHAHRLIVDHIPCVRMMLLLTAVILLHHTSSLLVSNSLHAGLGHWFLTRPSAAVFGDTNLEFVQKKSFRRFKSLRTI